MHDAGLIKVSGEDISVMQGIIDDANFKGRSHRIFTIHFTEKFIPDQFEERMRLALERIEATNSPGFAILNKDWQMHDGEKPPGMGKDSEAIVKKGRHAIERIRNPLGHDGYWLVLQGTKIGMAEKAWYQWGKEYDEWEIILDNSANRLD